MSQNLQNFVRFQKFQLENLVDFEKCCQTHIYLQKSEPIQPKTSIILPKIRSFRTSSFGRRLPAQQSHGGHAAPAPAFQAPWRSSCRDPPAPRVCSSPPDREQTLEGSFSAVSKRTFARKHAFDSIFQALQDLHPFAPLRSQNFRKKSV